MSFHDLLNAIIAQTDTDIACLKEAHAARVAALKHETKQWISRCEREIAMRATERKQELLARAEAKAFLERRRTVTQCKHNLLDTVYRKTIDTIVALPVAETEKLLSKLLEGIPGSGIIRPTSAHRALLKKLATDKRFTLGQDVPGNGGFLFQGEHEERDCTYENLVRNTLRPRTEMQILRTLFPSEKK